MMIGVVKNVFFTVVAILVYNYVILPLTVPELTVNQEFGEKDLKWKEDDVFWFIQLTDLHISKFKYPDIKEALEDFATITLDAIQPALVLASGDLTDGKDEDGVDSFQVLEEWQTYKRILDEHKVDQKTIYLDIRGNHDSFNVHHLQHPHNLHRNYSAKGWEHPSSYIYDYSFGGRVYSFFAVDATLSTGPKKVFNFLGQLTQENYDTILAAKAERSENKQIYFGHYPSSCVVAPSPGFRQIISGGLVYLSGHLHTLGGLAPQLYSMHRCGTPELELGDWKENRMYRVLAIDNGILSFSDNVADDWPVILVTNPKESRFLAPTVEPVQKIRDSASIRVLAFSPDTIETVWIQVNNGAWQKSTRSSTVSHLYTVDWEPKLLRHRLNKLTVTATDETGRSKTVQIQFQVDMEEIADEYTLYARTLLMSDVYSVLRWIWILSFLLSILPLVLARMRSPVVRSLFSLSISSKLEELSDFGPTYYLHVGTALLVAFGPWHIGEILENHSGIIFPWATIVAGEMLPSFYPYVFSFIHLLLFHAPLLWSLIYKFRWRVDGNRSKVLLAISNIPVTVVLSSQACMLLILYYFPSRLGIFREICLLIAPMEVTTILLGFIANGLVSFYIAECRKK